MASPLPARRRAPSNRRARTILGWLGAAALIGFVAFSVGRPASDAGRAVTSPSPSHLALPIAFGRSLDPVTGEASALTDRFVAGETFAYSVRTAEPHGTSTVHVEVLRAAGGGLAPVQTPAPQALEPDGQVIAFQVPADALLAAFGAGDFVMRIYLDPSAAPLAEGRFSLVAPVVPSVSPAP